MATASATTMSNLTSRSIRSKDKRIRVGFYAVAPSPVDGSIWGTVTGFPGSVVRVDPGANPPATALSEIYEVPPPGFGPRGGDIDSQGVMWAALASGHLGAFDRRKCKGPLTGPVATGKHCPEGWTLYPLPGPQLAGVTENGSGETPDHAWVDQHDTFGLGKDVAFATGNQNDSPIALKDGKMINLRVLSHGLPPERRCSGIFRNWRKLTSRHVAGHP